MLRFISRISGFVTRVGIAFGSLLRPKPHKTATPTTNKYFHYKDDLNPYIDTMWEILRSKDMQNFCTQETFTYTEDNGAIVWRNLIQYMEFEVKFYFPKWYNFVMRRVPAYTISSRYPGTIFVNANYRLTKAWIIKIFCHEYCHLRGYGHGSNVPHGKKYWNSVPNKVDKFLYQYLNDNYAEYSDIKA